jgi:hypothetical protein
MLRFKLCHAWHPGTESMTGFLCLLLLQAVLSADLLSHWQCWLLQGESCHLCDLRNQVRLNTFRSQLWGCQVSTSVPWPIPNTSALAKHWDASRTLRLQQRGTQHTAQTSPSILCRRQGPFVHCCKIHHGFLNLAFIELEAFSVLSFPQCIST